MTASFNKKAILAWCLYDWGLSAFPVVVTTFVIATYFTNTIATNEVIGTHQWGNAMALAGLLTALLSPVLGAIADYNGRRKYWLGITTSLIIISSFFLWFAYPNSDYVFYTLTCVVIGTLALNVSMVFYNALLPNLAPQDYVGRISGWGWGLGYFGGLIVLLIAFFSFVNGKPSWLNTETFQQIRICGPLVAIWTFIFALPLFLFVSDFNSRNLNLISAIQKGMIDLKYTIAHMFKEKNILIFLIAQMIYIDGLNTLFAFGGIYAAGTFHMTLSEVLLFGIVLNAFAGIGSILLAWIDDLIGAKKTILLSLLLLSLFSLGTVLVQQKNLFWLLACCLSLFVGPIQSSSRSLMAQLIPKEKATEMFGFYILSGKVTTFIGPWLVGFLTLEFTTQRVGMGSLLLFFILGAIILTAVKSK